MSAGKSREAQRKGAQPSGASHAKGYPTVEAHGALASTPINNMGENSGNRESYEAVEVVLTSSGKRKIMMIQKPANEGVCIIDWLNFTVSEKTWWKTHGAIFITNDSHVVEASRILKKIFGFAVTEKRQTGMNFYQESWVLGEGMGFVCFGGQRGTMLISITGQGCAHAAAGWQERLYAFLSTEAVRPQISRIDLAHDCLDGSYLSVDWAEAQWAAGGYNASKGGRAPNIVLDGNWHKPDGSGRTVYIGTRTSGKFARIYEKGKAEGDKLSNWCRFEVEFKACDRILPLDMLIRPSGYFAGAYRCIAGFAQHPNPTRLVLKEKTAEINVAASIEITHHQYGKYLRVFRELYGDQSALDQVCAKGEKFWPKRLKPLTVSLHTCGPDWQEAASHFAMGDNEFQTALPQFALLGKTRLSKGIRK